MNTNDIWLIAGLGNPEPKYDGTRHNAGFSALDDLAGRWGISVSKTKFQGLWGQGEVDGHKVVPPQAPDLYESLGRLHRPAGGLLQDPRRPRHRPLRRHHPKPRQAAHPALRLGRRPQRPQEHHRPPRRRKLPRIRIGVGAKPRPDYDLADWVLGKFPPDDAKALADRLPDLEAAAKLIMDGKLGLAQSKYNG